MDFDPDDDDPSEVAEAAFSAAFSALQTECGGNIFDLGYAWCQYRLRHAADCPELPAALIYDTTHQCCRYHLSHSASFPGMPPELLGLKEVLKDAEWYGGPLVVVAEVLRSLCMAYRTIIQTVPPESRWTFAEGWLTSWREPKAKTEHGRHG